MAKFTHPSKGISPKCILNEFEPVQVWSKLITPNQFLFTLPKQVTFNIICENKSTICTARNSGIISLPQHCIIQTNNMEITAENIYQGELPSVVVPEINITDIVNESINYTAKSTAIKNGFQLDPQYKELEDAIKAQKAEQDSFTTIVSWHDVHHYAAVYFIVGIIIITIIGFIWALRRHHSITFVPRINQRENINIVHASGPPVASPRSTESSDEIIF